MIELPTNPQSTYSLTCNSCLCGADTCGRWDSNTTASQFKHCFPRLIFMFDHAAKENYVAEYEDY